jgi:hypothetical protein
MIVDSGSDDDAMNYDGRCDAAEVPLFVQTLLSGCSFP